MVFGYGYCWWQNQWWRTNTPRPPSVSMAMAVRRSNTDGIARCGMSRATPEATGCRHRVTTCSVLPQWLPEQQANKQQSTNTPKKVAMLMAAAVRRYNTARITRWRRSRALLEATGCCHWASIMSNNINRTWLQRFFLCFHRQNVRKRSRVDAKNPVFNKGMTYQMKENALLRWVYNLLGWSNQQNDICKSGIVLHLYLLDQCLDPMCRTSIKICNFVTFYKFLIYLGVHHTIADVRFDLKLNRIFESWNRWEIQVGGETCHIP